MDAWVSPSPRCLLAFLKKLLLTYLLGHDGGERPRAYTYMYHTHARNPINPATRPQLSEYSVY